jgi:hypothetical protein
MNGQSIEPGIEPPGVAQASDVTPGSKKRVLDRVLRKLAVTEDQPSRCVQPRDGRFDELGEGVMIASLRSLDETLLVHMRLDCGATDSVALYTYGVGATQKVHRLVDRDALEARCTCRLPS